MSIYRDQSGVVKATALSFIILCILILATGAKTEWPQYHIVIIFIYRRAFIIVIYIYICLLCVGFQLTLGQFELSTSNVGRTLVVECSEF